MRPVTTLAWLAMTGITLAAPGPKDPPKTDPQLIGEWRLDRVDGERIKLDRTESFAADGSRITRTRKSGGRQSEDRFRYTANPTARPAEIDLFAADEGGNIQGIYKVEGDTLTVCYFRSAKEGRPKEFKAVIEGDNPAGLFVLKRVKPKD